ncbi:MAG: CDP-glycerol glycerophosphotransferase family protein [Candidatus Lokiarchaeota archaeon]|nr:CDP-glycerol glycerophosphotransferase family protein [Candidatus Lokiarchaeota archaeon]
MIFSQIFALVKKYSSIRLTKIYMFINVILLPLLIKHFSRFYSKKIDEKLIILGAYGGEAFIGNTKYLFKFLNEHSKYKIIWVTKSKSLIDKLNRDGYRALYTYSFNTIKVLRKAQFVFLTHGFEDVLPIDFSPKTIIILTWHGTPIKKINVDDRRLLMIKKWGIRLRLKLQFHQYVDYLLSIAGGDYEKKVLCTAFRIPLKKLISLGYPRNDVLFRRDQDFVMEIREFYKIPPKIDKILIYVPTFREDRKFNFPVSYSDLERLNNLLSEKNYLLLIKAHIYEREINFSMYKNIRLVEKGSDVQELLLISDLLITDYSSVIFDYLLKMKPILIFAYDYKDYLKKVGMYYNLQEIAPGPILYNADELINAIKNIEKVDVDYSEKRKEIRDKFNKYLDGKSTERILNYFKIEYS